MTIKTMAVRITEDTYPIAVACLPSTFSQIKKKLVFDSYLVINDLKHPGYEITVPEDSEDVEEPRYPRGLRYGHGGRHARGPLVLTNFWVPKSLFKKDFKVVSGKLKSGQFVEITRR